MKSSKKLTAEAEAILGEQGVQRNLLSALSPKTRRMLANALKVEFSQMEGNPEERRDGEFDVVETINIALDTLKNGERVLSRRTGEEIYSVGCKTSLGKEALKGICAQLGYELTDT